jgi:hypothetical protein
VVLLAVRALEVGALVAVAVRVGALRIGPSLEWLAGRSRAALISLGLRSLSLAALVRAALVAPLGAITLLAVPRSVLRRSAGPSEGAAIGGRTA